MANPSLVMNAAVSVCVLVCGIATYGLMPNAAAGVGVCVLCWRCTGAQRFCTCVLCCGLYRLSLVRPHELMAADTDGWRALAASASVHLSLAIICTPCCASVCSIGAC
jgi:hypothetical protein